MTEPVAPAERGKNSMTPPLAEVRNVRKQFGSVVALHDVSITIKSGEVAAIVGDNGAGKSTLVKILTGVHQPTSGVLFFDGKPVVLHHPDDARRHGIETLFQDLALVDDLTIWQNLFLGRELTWGGPSALPASAPWPKARAKC